MPILCLDLGHAGKTPGPWANNAGTTAVSGARITNTQEPSPGRNLCHLGLKSCLNHADKLVTSVRMYPYAVPAAP